MNDLEKAQSCIIQVTNQEPYLTGEGTIVVVIDSGIDYFLPEFTDENGNTRILSIWDQSGQPDSEQGLVPPEGYIEGVLYTRNMINEALSLGREEGMKKVPVYDLSGHGTAVAAVAAGTDTGVAPKADIAVVKLGKSLSDGFPRTTQLMRGIDYGVKLGVSLNRPVVLNISFGNTYGDHKGNSLLERFIDNAAQVGRTSIVIGSGNEGTSSGHTAGAAKEARTVELAVAEYETGLSIQIWKYYQDIFDVTVISPGGERLNLPLPDISEAGTVRKNLENTTLLCYVGKPQPYNVQQEVFIDMIPVGNYLNSGVWKIELKPVEVVTGEYRMYLPGYAARNAGTGFFLPTPEMTITIPSTSRNAITVGAYDVARRSYADFSGRGYVYRYSDGRGDTSIGRELIAAVKPDIVAPGVNITVPVPYGGYEKVSGTSFATPFVTGVCALLMEWGIVRGNDRFLYGERLKASLISGSNPLPGVSQRPDSKAGWGTLCAFGALRTE
jgi:subtilisin family serine protease